MGLDKLIAEKRQEVLAFRSALSKETDRGCALFATSYVDQALSELLSACLVDDKNIRSDLFDGTAPLATFSARIKMCFYLGKITKDERRDLDLLRKIRNDFAHNSSPIDFNEPRISSRCKELSFSYHSHEWSSRGHFSSACLALLGTIHNETWSSQAMNSQDRSAPSEDDKIEARLNAVQGLYKGNDVD